MNIQDLKDLIEDLDIDLIFENIPVQETEEEQIIDFTLGDLDEYQI